MLKYRKIPFGKGYTMEYEYYPEEYMSGHKKKKGLVGKILKWMVIGLILFVYLFLMFRIFIKSDTKIAKTFVWTEDTVAAYESDPASFEAFTQDNTYVYYDTDTETAIEYAYDTYSGSDEDNTHEGQFHTSQFVYVPSSKEFQITLRYNRDGVRELLNTYGLEKAPAGELFCFALTDGTNIYTDYTFLTDSRFTYQYRRLTFSGVDLEDVSQMWLQIYFIGDVSVSSPYESMTVYLSDIPMESYKVKKALPAEVNGTLQSPPYIVYED